VDYHTRNKLLLMAYDKETMTRMGDILANHRKRSFEETAADYQQYLQEALSRPAGIGSNINVLIHAVGYFSDRLDANERALLNERLSEYREDNTLLGELKGLFISWILRFDVRYLLLQTYFCPYPAGLSGRLE
jgi:uncharacterized protein YbgA (DUF1722 family)